MSCEERLTLTLVGGPLCGGVIAVPAAAVLSSSELMRFVKVYDHSPYGLLIAQLTGRVLSYNYQVDEGDRTASFHHGYQHLFQ